VGEALARGAVGAVVGDGVAVAGPAVQVGSTGEALLRLAADERARHGDARLIAVTGANGKTSTKDLAAAVLASRFRVHASPASFNNEIGLPLTLLSAPEGAEVIVAEMGARRVGDHTVLCEVARPDVVVVTNVGVAHMEVFGSWDRIVEASAEPVEWLGEDGLAILLADDPVVAGFGGRTRARVLTFGLSRAAGLRAEDVRLDRDGLASFALATGDARERVELAVPGEHMIANALAAAACGVALGMTAAECAAGLKGARVSRWRMETFASPGGIRVVNDAYNANPESVAAALRAARWIAGDGRLIAVLGTMAELGPVSAAEHARIGELAARIRVERLVTVGAEARAIAVAAAREGIPAEEVASYDDVEEALDDVLRHARRGDVVLFKASRVVGLERAAEAMR
jgi:UDP-N-acetylmuramoyl-tripeptide--D-alanyl-D-alanine ligase